MRWSLFRSSPRRGVGGHTEGLRTFTQNWNCKNQQRGSLLPMGSPKMLGVLMFSFGGQQVAPNLLD
jgi:hypothetical protein